ncbi:MAG: DUF309 domain-containing protein [Anaerolineae bacterium]
MKPSFFPPIVALCNDLLFATRLSDVIRQLGGEPVIANTPDELRRGLERWPLLILLDLAALPAAVWQPEVQRAKVSPQTKHIPIYAFGSHVDTALLASARQAGCDHVWARSRFMGELPQVIDTALHPPTVYVDGWDAAPSPEFLHGIALFNAGELHAQHDVFEALWREDLRPIRELYQGVLQVGLALYHIEGDNYRGAVKMFRRGLPRLRTLPPVCQTLDVARLRTEARALHDQLIALGPDHFPAFERAQVRAFKLHLIEG